MVSGVRLEVNASERHEKSHAGRELEFYTIDIVGSIRQLFVMQFHHTMGPRELLVHHSGRTFQPTMATNTAYIPPHPTIKRVRRFLSHYRIRISLIVICGLIATDMTRGSHPHSPINLVDAWSAIGLFLVIAGTSVRSWAAGNIKKNTELSTNGPYAITRNPLYVGSFLMMAGFSTLAGTLHDFVAMLLLAVILYRPKIKNEEAYLQQKFGPVWNEYVLSTPHLLAFRFNVQALRSDWSFAQWRRNREHITVGAVMLGLVVFQIWFELTK